MAGKPENVDPDAMERVLLGKLRVLAGQSSRPRHPGLDALIGGQPFAAPPDAPPSPLSQPEAPAPTGPGQAERPKPAEPPVPPPLRAEAAPAPQPVKSDTMVTETAERVVRRLSRKRTVYFDEEDEANLRFLLEAVSARQGLISRSELVRRALRELRLALERHNGLYGPREEAGK